jgi:hypothetical protein
LRFFLWGGEFHQENLKETQKIENTALQKIITCSSKSLTLNIGLEKEVVVRDAE